VLVNIRLCWCISACVGESWEDLTHSIAHGFICKWVRPIFPLFPGRHAQMYAKVYATHPVCNRHQVRARQNGYPKNKETIGLAWGVTREKKQHVIFSSDLKPFLVNLLRTNATIVYVTNYVKVVRYDCAIRCTMWCAIYEVGQVQLCGMSKCINKSSPEGFTMFHGRCQMSPAWCVRTFRVDIPKDPVCDRHQMRARQNASGVHVQVHHNNEIVCAWM
jgi:hypothetical protein